MSKTIEKDLEIARREIMDGWGTAIVRHGVVLDREKGKGLRPALQMARRRESTGPCAFADKVLGLAAFRLGRAMGATVMWGEMASSLALSEGKRSGIEVRYHLLVPAVMNAALDNLCPMERLAFLTGDDDLFFWRVDGMVH
ncbi:MAG: DUF1893 domain-containing protein [Bacillota bacterium]